MLKKLIVHGFKLFDKLEIPLGNGFVFVGPNNSGKTSALQALTLWHAGLREWVGKRMPQSGGDSEIPAKRPGVTVNLRDVAFLPAPHANLLWRGRKVNSANNEKILLKILVEGVDLKNEKWRCGLEFDYANAHSFHCRPLRVGDNKSERIPVPEAAREVNIAFLPPMSGMSPEEPLLKPGRINVLLGRGETAQVLRNLCYTVAQDSPDLWKKMQEQLKELFGVDLLDPKFFDYSGEVAMEYSDPHGGGKLELTSAGRGMQQVMLLLAFLYANKSGAVLLLDEPDAHLEILRQREIYAVLRETADALGSQIIAASHSEVLLNEAAQIKSAVAFVGVPHILGEGKTKDALKALREIGYEYYSLAERDGWMLYLEGTTDLSILQAFARRMKHRAQNFLARPPIKYIENDRPQDARRHFSGLREAKPDLMGLLLLDNTPRSLPSPMPGLVEIKWRKCEIENYLCGRETLLRYAKEKHGLFYSVMELEIEKTLLALEQIGGPFSDNTKVSDFFLAPIFKNFARATNTPILEKKDYKNLVEFIPDSEIDPEIEEKLDAIAGVAEEARARNNNTRD